MRGLAVRPAAVGETDDQGLVVLAPIPFDARAARAGASQARVVHSGIGSRLSRRAAERARRAPGSAVAVTGVCMAIDPTLEAGDLVLASEIRYPDGTVPIPAAGILAGALRRAGIEVRVGPIVSGPHGIGLLRSERARLRESGAIAADTGSGWLASGAGGRPFAVLRAVVRSGSHQLGRPLVAAASGARAHRRLAEATWVLDRWAHTVAPRRVVLAGPRASCAGVERAIEVVERALERHGAPVYVRREIVHNRHVVSELEQRGAVFVHEVDEVPEGALAVLSAHGVAPSVRAMAARRELDLIDATCPLVAKVHREARQFADAGYTIVLVGHEGHDEVEGTVGHAPERIRLVADVAEAEAVQVDDPERVAYLTQTTLAVDETRAIVAVLERRFPGLVGPRSDDICYATQNRQDAVREVASVSDTVLVVGSRNSSNSNRLVEVARRAGTPAYLIDDEQDIELGWLDGARTVGLAAGASAPERLVQRVLASLGGLGPLEVEERSVARETVRFGLPRELGVTRGD
jgi:4-hydroxy-3-methylbut-2-en-1-yl diphosphate reductase